MLGAWGPYPAPGGALRGHLLQRPGGAALLVGCGGGVAARLGYHLRGWDELGAVLLPDLHPAHIADLWPLGSQTVAAVGQGLRRGLLPAYAPVAQEAAWRALGRPGVLDVRGVAPGDRPRLAGWRVELGRDRTPAIRIGGETGEAGFVPAGARLADQADLLRGVGLLVVEMAPADGEDLPAPDLATAAADLAMATGAHMLVLSHLDPEADAAGSLAAARARFPQTALALEGRTYHVPPGLTPPASSPA